MNSFDDAIIASLADMALFLESVGLTDKFEEKERLEILDVLAERLNRLGLEDRQHFVAAVKRYADIVENSDNCKAEALRSLPSNFGLE